MVKYFPLLFLATFALASGTSPLYPPGQADSQNSAPVVISSEQLNGELPNEQNQLDMIDRLDSILAEEATEAKQDIGNGLLLNIDGTLDVNLSTRLSEAAFLTFASQNNTDLLGVQSRQDTTNLRIGDVTETPPATDTASSGLNGRLQRLAQRLSTLIGLAATETTLQGTNSRLDTANGHLNSLDSDIDVLLSSRASEQALIDFHSDTHTDLLGIQSRQDTTNSTLAETNLRLGDETEAVAASDTANSGLNGLLKRLNQHSTTLEGYTDGLEGLITSSNTKLDTVNSNLVTVHGKQDAQTALLTTIRDNADEVEPRIGALNETAPGTDTASSGLNGRLQRVAQNITTLNATNTENGLRIGDETESAAATDTSTSGLNGLFKRLLQRMTTLISFYAADFGASSGSIRTAAQVGNSTGAASFGAGATSAQTLRTASNLYDGSGNAVTSQTYDSQRPVHVYMLQIGASNATHTRITLTNSVSVQIAAANSARKWLYIENQSGAKIFIKFGTAAVINQAIEIPNNNTFKMSATELYLGAINAIVGSNNRTIEVVEGF